MTTYKYGDQCVTRLPIINQVKRAKKQSSNIQVPERSVVSIVSTSENMAIIKYGKECYSTRIENLEPLILTQA